MELIPHHIEIIDKVTEELCSEELLRGVLHKTSCNYPMPSLERLHEFMERLKAALFPGFFGKSKIHYESIRYHTAANLDSIYRIIKEQIMRGGGFANADYVRGCKNCEHTSHELAEKFIGTLPKIRKFLAGDARAAFEGDPAATSPGEAIFCYPSMLAMIHHRIAHELYLLNIPVIPRILSEMAHSQTGIDIHPGANIGEDFFIDHGTGVVIGETCIIGKSCRVYQGVTLGALSFPKGENGTLIKGNLRHPILKDNVIVYAGATILGRITIGTNCVIGGNTWVTDNVPDNTKVMLPKSDDCYN